MPQTCANTIVTELADHGIDTVFGIPGVHTLDLYRALAATDLRHVTPRHEQSAAFMADGYARASGRMAACFLISGPGLLNAATAIGQAASDSVPMMVVATVTGSPDLGLRRGRLHEVRDQFGAMQGLLGDAAVRVHRPEQARPAVRMLMAKARLGRPRPVYLELPIDIAAERQPAQPDGFERRPGNFARAALHPDEARRTADMLANSKRPVIIAGGGSIDAASTLTRLARRLGAVVITTIAGKGVVPETDPHSAGACLNLPLARALIDDADLVMAVGTELASPDTFVDRLEINAPLIRIDIDPEILGRDQVAALALHSDAANALDAIEAALEPGSPKPCWKDDLSGLRDALRSETRRRKPVQATVLDCLAGALGDDGILVTDMTQIAYTGNAYFMARAPRTWFHPVGFGTLGYALPAAIGAMLACPGRKVVALAGDYGVGFTLPDLATAADLKLGLPVVVWNNGGLGQIAADMESQDIPLIGVGVRPPDFRCLAEGYGADYARPAGAEALSEALRRAFAAPRPTVIEVEAGRGWPG